MGVSKNRGTPKWMVYNGKPYSMDDLGVPLFLETPMWMIWTKIWSDLEDPSILSIGSGRSKIVGFCGTSMLDAG